MVAIGTVRLSPLLPVSAIDSTVDIITLYVPSHWFYCDFFFFSSRRRHTRCSRDWSSDVCSSDLDDLGRGLSDPARCRRDHCHLISESHRHLLAWREPPPAARRRLITTRAGPQARRDRKSVV